MATYSFGEGGGGSKTNKVNGGGRGVRTQESWANVLCECPLIELILKDVVF